MKSLAWLFGVLLCSSVVSALDDPCLHEFMGYDSSVCVCNSTQCDRFPQLRSPTGDDVVVVTSTRDGDRFAVSSAQWSSESVVYSPVTVTVKGDDKKQTIFGFGAAFTDAAGEDINKLPEETRKVLLEQYFGEGGIGYRLGRVPIGGADFSSRAYTLDDVEGDEKLEHWALQDEDHQLKLPMIKQAMAMSEHELFLFGSAWSAPAWMKNNSQLTGLGSLKLEYYQLWADYYIKFLQAYKEEGVTIRGLTTQNEPTNGGFDGPGHWNTMGWSPEMQADWLKNNFGPTVRAYDENITIMILDDQRKLLPDWADTMLADPETAAFADLIAVHWYTDSYTPASKLSDTHDKHPDIPLLYTEACEGSHSPQPDKVALGDWGRLETYAGNIIEDLNNWVTGWTDWNICLNMEGGPNWAGNNVDSPIIIDEATGRFYKNPMFYGLGHISATMPPRSTVVGTQVEAGGKQVVATAALRRSGEFALALLSKEDNPTEVTVTEASRGGSLSVTLPARSLTTLLWAAQP